MLGGLVAAVVAFAVSLVIITGLEAATGNSLAGNQGTPACTGGRKGSRVAVPGSVQDERRRQEILASTVLPRWVQRCGARCSQVWNQTIGPVRGLTAPAAKQ